MKSVEKIVDEKKLYQQRFEDTDMRNNMWKILCTNFFQKYIPEDCTIVEIAAGYCEFINNIKAKNKIAVDINEDVKMRASKEVQAFISLSTDLSKIENQSIDRIFISNFFEHISKSDIEKTLVECLRILKSDGKILILQPNIRFVRKDYWMFWDHITPIDDRALVECMNILGYKINLCIPRFLPYTTSSFLPVSMTLLKIYLRIPLLYKIFGGQAFIIASKS